MCVCVCTSSWTSNGVAYFCVLLKRIQLQLHSTPASKTESTHRVIAMEFESLIPKK